jgi:hypothetical protein
MTAIFMPAPKIRAASGGPACPVDDDRIELLHGTASLVPSWV